MFVEWCHSEVSLALVSLHLGFWSQRRPYLDGGVGKD